MIKKGTITRALLLLLLLTEAATARSDHLQRYAEAREALDQKQWRTAADLLEQAIDAQPQPGGFVRSYGMRSVRYLPHFDLGVALHQLGNCTAALKAWSTAEHYGAVRKHEKDLANLQRRRKACRDEIQEIGTADRIQPPPPSPPPPPPPPPPSGGVDTEGKVDSEIVPTETDQDSPIDPNHESTEGEGEGEAPGPARPVDPTNIDPTPPLEEPNAPDRGVPPPDHERGVAPQRPSPEPRPQALVDATRAFFGGRYVSAIEATNSLLESKRPVPSGRTKAAATLIRAAARFTLWALEGRPEGRVYEALHNDLCTFRALSPVDLQEVPELSPRFQRFAATTECEP